MGINLSETNPLVSPDAEPLNRVTRLEFQQVLDILALNKKTLEHILRRVERLEGLVGEHINTIPRVTEPHDD